MKKIRMGLWLSVWAISWVVLSGVGALAQTTTYPPSLIPPTSGTVPPDDTAFTGSGSIESAAIIAIVLLAIGITVLLWLRQRTPQD